MSHRRIASLLIVLVTAIAPALACAPTPVAPTPTVAPSPSSPEPPASAAASTSAPPVASAPSAPAPAPAPPAAAEAPPPPCIGGEILMGACICEKGKGVDATGHCVFMPCPKSATGGTVFRDETTGQCMECRPGTKPSSDGKCSH